jgi:hypothetical protein
MNINQIPSLLEQFSVKRGFEYDREKLPFIPFGGVSGIYKGNKVYLYIKAGESRAAHFYYTVFGLSDGGIFPEKFSVEYYGNPDRLDSEFMNMVNVLSFDASIVKNFMDENKESVLKASFKMIDKIDESIFKVRSTVRLNEDGISLTTQNCLEDIVDLNTAFDKVADVFVEVKKHIASNM